MTRNLCVFGFVAALALSAADLPYAGKWKMNPARSDFGGTTFEYVSLPSGEWECRLEGQHYKFKMDEKDYPDPFGTTAAWKAVDGSTWQMVSKLNGKVLSTDTLKLSADGGSLIISTTGTKPNGEAIDATTTAQRLSGGPGLAGKWRVKNVKAGSPSILELSPSGSDGLSYKVTDLGLSCEGKLDGKDYPCTGATLAAGWTVAMSNAGGRSLDLLVKKDAKPFYKVTYTVSADGKTLTETGGPTSTNEKVKVVYDRQ
jgi:hypothetical protein